MLYIYLITATMLTLLVLAARANVGHEACKPEQSETDKAKQRLKAKLERKLRLKAMRRNSKPCLWNIPGLKNER